MTGISASFEEGNIRFTFDSSWEVIKYDDSDIHRKRLMKLQGSKAVDFVAHRRPKGKREFFLIEVKDLRGHRTKNKERITSGEIVREVACKVRDTVAGLYGARRCNKLSGKLGDAFVETLDADRRNVKVILWLEEDFRAPGWHSSLMDEFKKQLHWLDSRVLVVSMQDGLPGVSAANLKGAGQGNDKRTIKEKVSHEPASSDAAPSRRLRRRRTKKHGAR